jgi:hypothetical protein
MVPDPTVPLILLGFAGSDPKNSLLKGMDEDKEWKMFVPVIKREKCESKGPKAVIIKNTEVAP